MMINARFCATVGRIAPESANVSRHEKLVYAVPCATLTMNLYLPAPTAQAVPCVVVIAGGGFTPQDGERFRPFAAYLAGHGFAAASIAYRGRPDHTCRHTLADVKAAVHHIRRIASQRNIDATRIGAMGQSAGATLAALLAVTGEPSPSPSDEESPTPSSRIQAAVGFAGVYDFVARFTDPSQIMLQPELEQRQQASAQWIGEAFNPTSKAWRDASPLHRLNRGNPPMLLAHCRDDLTVPWLQSQMMYEKMQSLGSPPKWKSTKPADTTVWRKRTDPR